MEFYCPKSWSEQIFASSVVVASHVIANAENSERYRLLEMVNERFARRMCLPCRA
jgi:hypothetical protein